MTPLNKISKRLSELMRERKDMEFPAFMGNLHTDIIKADNSGNVFVTLWNGEVLTVYNNQAPLILRRPVIIGYEKSKPYLFQVLRSRDSYFDSPYPDVPEHWEKTHMWGMGGADIGWVRGEQFLPGLAVPSSGLVVRFFGLVYFLNGWHVLDNQDIDLSTEVPTSGALYILVEASETGTITFNTGTAVDNRYMLTYEDIPTPTHGKAPLFAVKMYVGQTEIQKTPIYTDIVDTRFAGNTSSVLWVDVSDAEASVVSIIDEFAIDSDGFRFAAGGRLAVVENIDSALVIAKNVNIYQWWLYVENTGSAGSTIIDIKKNGVTVFTDPADRPEVAYDSVDGKVLATADVTAFAAGDIVTCDIVEIATGAESISVTGSVLIPLTVTANPNTFKDIGDPDPVFAYTSSIPDVVFTGSLSREAGETQGPYNITVGTLAAPSRYNMTFVSNVFGIADELAVSAVTVIDTYSTFAAGRIIDGDDATQWSSATWKDTIGTVWFKLDMGSPKIITSFRLLQGASPTWAYHVKVYGSANDIDYVLAYDSGYFGPPLFTPVSEIPISGLGIDSPATRQYWKFVCENGPTGSGWEVFDVTARGW